MLHAVSFSARRELHEAVVINCFDLVHNLFIAVIKWSVILEAERLICLKSTLGN